MNFINNIMENREIKFRVWSLASEKMSEPFSINQRLNQIFNTDSLLMQYTGLKDKNAVEIYEGDIIEIFDDESTKGQVVFNEGSFRLFEKTTYYSHLSAYNPISMCEIIGNIYQNPELCNQ